MSLTTLDSIKANLAQSLSGIERYNPNNIATLENYVQVQVDDNGYDLEANLALLKLYQFNPTMLNLEFVCKVLLKSLANLPHSDFLLCKSLLSEKILDDPHIKTIQNMANLLEECDFKQFWEKSKTDFSKLIKAIAGFEDSMRKFVCHVVSATYQRIPEERLCELLGLSDEKILNQWIDKNGWTSTEDNFVTISNQDESIKTKKITEKIDMESVAGIMASCF